MRKEDLDVIDARKVALKVVQELLYIAEGQQSLVSRVREGLSHLALPRMEGKKLRRKHRNLIGSGKLCPTPFDPAALKAPAVW